MRNLKRVLSLALAVMMLIGMMVVGANAAGINDFTDKDEIVNKDAVGMLTTLGIINGMEDGSYFAPTQGVDRAMMAKMISVIMNQGADNSALYENVATGLTDVNNSWAKGHINYCYTLGIIAGRGNGTFDPNAGVTALEAAKMLLVAAGYDPKIEGFEGSNWAVNVSAKADAVGIFANFTKDVTAPLSRDDAALLIYNALDVEMIQKYEDGYAIAYADHRTILSTKYGVIKVQGVVTANEWAVLDDDSDTALKEGLTRIENAEGIFSTTTNTTVPEQGNVTSGTFKVSTPVEMLGHSVTMYIKKTTILADSIVYGTPVLADNNSVTVGDGKLDDTMKDAKLLADKNTEYYQNYAEVAAKDFAAVKGASLTIVDNDNDGIVDYVIQVEKTLTEISTYNEKSDVITAKGVASEEFANVVGADDVAKDDVVLAVTYGGRLYVEKPEVVTGEMTSFNTKITTERYMVVDGDKYYEDGLKVATGVDPYKFDVTKCDNDDVDGVQFNSTYNFYLDNFGYVVAFEEVEAAPANYALVTDSAWTKNSLKYSGEVELLLPDGTETVYTVDWKSTKTRLDYTDGELAQLLGSDDVVIWPNGDVDHTNAGAAKGLLVTYTLNEDGTVVLGYPDLSLSGNAYASYADADFDLPFTSNLEDAAGNNNFDANRATLGAAIEQGDTKFVLNNNGANYVYKDGKDWDGIDVGTPGYGTNSTLLNYGIDDETIVYYVNGNNMDVVIGYDNLYETINGGANTHFVDAVMYNPVETGTKVAKVLVVRGDYAEPDNSKYALVTNVWDTYDDYKIYSAVLEDGSVVELKSEQVLNDIDGVNNMVYKYTTNSEGETTFTSVFSNGVKNNAYYVDGDDTTLVANVRTGNNVAFGYVHVPYAKWVETWHDRAGTTIWDEMLANKNADVIYNVYDLTEDDEQAGTVSFKDGQQAVIVYDENGVVKCAWVIADVADEVVTPDEPKDPELVVTITEDFELVIYNPNNATVREISAAIVKALEDKGCTDVTVTVTNGKITKVEAKDGKLNLVFSDEDGNYVEAADSQDELNDKLTAAAAGDTIYVGTGTYEVAPVTKNVTIVGNGETTFEPASAGGTVFTVKKDAELTVKNVVISSDAATGYLVRNDQQTDTGILVLDGCTFDGGRISVLLDGLNGATITNCTFRNYAKAAISIGDSVKGDVVISGNDFGKDTDSTVFVEYDPSVLDCIKGTDFAKMSAGEKAEI